MVMDNIKPAPIRGETEEKIAVWRYSSWRRRWCHQFYWM